MSRTGFVDISTGDFNRRVIRNLLLTAAQALWLNPLRSILSMLGVLFGVASLIAMLAVTEGLQQEVLDQIHLLGTHNLIARNPPQAGGEGEANSNKTGYLQQADVQMLKATLAQTIGIAPIIEIKSQLAAAAPNAPPTEILATTPDFVKVKELAMVSGRFLCDADEQNNNLVAVIGYDVAQALGTQGSVGGVLKLGSELFTVVGIISKQEIPGKSSGAITLRNLNRIVLIPLLSESALIPGSAKNPELPLDEIIIRFEPDADVLKAAQTVRASLARARGGEDRIQLIIPQELLQQARKTQQIFSIVLGCITGISLLVGGIGIMNILLATISERSHEIGIRRAVGATRLQIVMQFLIEALCIAFCGAAIGFVSGLGLAQLISWYFSIHTIITFTALAIAGLMAFIVGVAAGVYPAHNAASIDPAVALRS